jgi:hypothetical protein
MKAYSRVLGSATAHEDGRQENMPGRHAAARPKIHKPLRGSPDKSLHWQRLAPSHRGMETTAQPREFLAAPVQRAQGYVPPLPPKLRLLLTLVPAVQCQPCAVCTQKTLAEGAGGHQMQQAELRTLPHIRMACCRVLVTRSDVGSSLALQ